MKVYWLNAVERIGGVEEATPDFLVRLYNAKGEIISGRQYVRWFLAGYSMEFIPPIWMLNLWH